MRKTRLLQITIGIAIGAIILEIFTSTFALPAAQELYSWLAFLVQVFLTFLHALVVASLIGVLIEVPHIRRFFERALAQALTNLDFLRRFLPETLDEIAKRSYQIKNEKSVTNPRHGWRDHYEVIWSRVKDYPIQPYLRPVTHTVDHSFYKSDKIPHEIAERLEGIEQGQGILYLKDTLVYRMISPTNGPFLVNVRSDDVVRIIPGVEANRCGWYEVSVEGRPHDVTPHTAFRDQDGRITFSLNYPITINGSIALTEICHTIEPWLENSFAMNFDEPMFDYDFEFTSNIPLRNIRCEYWFLDPEMFEPEIEVVALGQTYRFSYEGLILPGNGFVIIWEFA